MDSRHLSQKQYDWFAAELSAMTRRLCQMRQRMIDRGFPSDDRLLQEIGTAYAVLWSAKMHAHSLSCQGNLGVTYFFKDANGVSHTKPESERAANPT